MTPVARPRAAHLAAWPCPATLTGLDADVCHLCQRLAQLIDPQELAFVCEHEGQPARRSLHAVRGDHHAPLN